MSVKAYTEDIQRAISVTPTVDITGQTVLAKVYKDGEYAGIANTVKPEPATASAVLSINNGGAGAEQVTVTILTKYRHEEEYTEVHSEVIDVAVGSAEYEVTYDQQDKEDVKAVLSDIGANCVVESLSVQQSQFTDLEGIVVGGAADEEVVIPCDFRDFEPGDDYSIVFVASNYGVIGRDVLILFGKDGYELES